MTSWIRYLAYFVYHVAMYLIEHVRLKTKNGNGYTEILIVYRREGRRDALDTLRPRKPKTRK